MGRHVQYIVLLSYRFSWHMNGSKLATGRTVELAPELGCGELTIMNALTNEANGKQHCNHKVESIVEDVGGKSLAAVCIRECQRPT